MTTQNPISPVTKEELQQRIKRLHIALENSGKIYDAVFIVDKVNQYYFTGTMQDGMFVLKADGSYAYFARRSFERAKLESPLGEIYPMRSYRDVYAKIGEVKTVFLEQNVLTLSMLARMEKHFVFKQKYAVDGIISKLRSIKSNYEIEQIMQAAKRHKQLLDVEVPKLLQLGISEAIFTARVYEKMIELGYQGVSRFSMFQTEIVAGQIGFGENAAFPTSFDGPGGMKGMYAPAPFVGEHNRKLEMGDLAFVDIGFGYNGYHSDRTQVYAMGQAPAEKFLEAHEVCRNIQKQTAKMLKPGAIPSEIYETITADIPQAFMQNFMGIGQDQVKFLGHGVGLYVDEYPVIARGFDEPLQEGMVIALEPKKSFPNEGIVGVEDTYLVTEKGGACITGGEQTIHIIKP